MSVSSFYIDTSALAKWYLNEAQSDEFSEWIQSIDRALISGLSKTEMRCLLARRRRMNELTPSLEKQLMTAFNSDIVKGHLICPPTDEACFEVGTQLIEQMPHIPLRSLDAIHLGLAQQFQVAGIATADCIFARAAMELDFTVRLFAEC